MALSKTSKITITKTSDDQKIKKLEVKRMEEPVVNDVRNMNFWESFSKFFVVGGDFV